MSWTVIINKSVEYLRGAAKRRLPLAPISYLPIWLGAAMPPHRRHSQKSAQPGGRADVDGECPGPASSIARKGTKGTSTRRPSDSNRRERHPKGEKAGR